MADMHDDEVVDAFRLGVRAGRQMERNRIESVDPFCGTEPANVGGDRPFRVPAVVEDEIRSQRKQIAALDATLLRCLNEVSQALGMSGPRSIDELTDGIEQLTTRARVAEAGAAGGLDQVVELRDRLAVVTRQADEEHVELNRMRVKLREICEAKTLQQLVDLIALAPFGRNIQTLGPAWFPIVSMMSPNARPFNANELEALATLCEMKAPDGGPIAWYSLRDRCRAFAAMLRDGAVNGG